MRRIGRGERIRTFDPLHPMQVRYQAALRPDAARIISASAVVPEEPADFFQLLPNFDQIRRISVGPTKPA